MKLTEHSFSSSVRIDAYDAAGFMVGGQAHAGALLVTPAAAQPWPFATLEAHDAAAMASLLDHAPALVLFGTGARQRFPAASVLRPLLEAGVGCEVMDTGAACRTFNLLAAEGRQVVAVLLPLQAVSR